MLSGRQLENIGASYVMSLLETNSPYGAELVRRPHFHAVGEHEALVRELERVAVLANALESAPNAFAGAERALMQLKDVRRSMERCAEFADAGGRAAAPALGDVELFELKRFLILLGPLKDAFDALLPDGLCGIEIHVFAEALDIVDPEGMRAFTFRVGDGCSELIAHIRAERRRLDLAIRTAAPEERDALTAERTLLAAREDEEEARIRAEMTRGLGKYAREMLKTTESIARLDFAMAKAKLLAELHGTVPRVEKEPCRLVFAKMTEPRTAAALRERGRRFTPIDISLGMGSTVITGANMGGKSVALKTLALNAYLALCGFPVFCAEAVLPHFSDIHLICGDMEDSAGGLSSFGGEMLRFDGILRSCRETPLSLVLLDEFARGTNPHEGSALVRAAVKYFGSGQHVMALITTHFDGVARFASMHYRVVGLHGADRDALAAALSADGKGSTGALERFMDYGLYPAGEGLDPPRDALTICRALGVDDGFMRMVDIGCGQTDAGQTDCGREDGKEEKQGPGRG